MDLIGLISSFGGLLYTVVAFVIAILIIVAVHEYGHYIVGRWTGIYTEVFSLGFGPVIWSGVDKRGTRWQLAAIPFGGYCKFLGDANAASGKDGEAIDALEADQRRHTMHGAPLWARTLTVAAGPVFNFILSMFVFAAVLGYNGTATDPLSIAELKPFPIEQGLEVGDELLSIGGIETPKLENFGDLVENLPPTATLEYIVRRDGKKMTVNGPHPYPAMVSSVTPGSAAMDANLKVNDVILAVDGQPIGIFEELPAIVKAANGEPLELLLWRDGGEHTVTLSPRRTDIPNPDGGFTTRWLMGISSGMVFVPATESLGPIEALTSGAKQVSFVISSSLSGLYHMAVGKISTCNMRGPIGIAQTAGEVASQGLENFIWLIALLSTAVGMMNLFPIPVLDGGHLVFYAFEAVIGRPPSDRAMRILMAVGLALLLGLMLFATSNDVFCP